MTTNSKGQRLKIQYVCSNYDKEKTEWVPSCETVYDDQNPSNGVMCFCNHNTSFAVLMVRTICPVIWRIYVKSTLKRPVVTCEPITV